MARWRVAVGVGISLLMSAASAAAQPATTRDSSTPEQHTPSAPSVVLLAPGQIQTVDTTDVTRVAIGEPEVADVTIISPKQILIQAKSVGSTNLILWDAVGQHQTAISVVDPASETIGKEIQSIVTQLNFPSVDVTLQSGKAFIIGEVATEAELEVLQQMADSFKDIVVNLVKVREQVKPPEPVGPPPLVKLSVQVVEINRTALDRLGVSWSSSLSATEPEVKALIVSLLAVLSPDEIDQLRKLAGLATPTRKPVSARTERRRRKALEQKVREELRLPVRRKSHHDRGKWKQSKECEESLAT
jgi:Flp pilus assembly secretin CpaC